MVDLCWLVLETLGPDCWQAQQQAAMAGAIAPGQAAQSRSLKTTAVPAPAVAAISTMTVEGTPALAPPCITAKKVAEPCEAPVRRQPIARINNRPVIEATFIPQTAPRPSAPQQDAPQGPTSGPQLYRQRQLSLQSGHLYTRLPVESFVNQWRTATQQPTYQNWLQLLSQEAEATAAGQGPNRLEVIVGDSLGLWLPPDTLPRDRLWLNQSISGDTTAGVLRRLDTFGATRPTVIHLMIGVNDLKNNVPEAEIVSNFRAIITRLQRQYPQAQLVVYSVLPTRRDDISNGRVRSLNQHIAYLASHHRIDHRDMLGLFGDQGGALRTDLTTDGLHLNRQGYSLWQQVIVAATNRV